MTTAPNAGSPALDRALPGWAVDAITDGVNTRDARQVYAKCISIAMSAYRRGWTEAQFVNEIAHVKSRLWAQLMTRRDGRTSSMPVALKSLRKAWATGVANSNSVGMRTRDEIAADAVELAYEWADRLDSGSDGLSATETAVMRYVIAQTVERGMFRVTCPGRAIEEAEGVMYRTATRTLKSLASKGLLVQHSAGRAGEPGRARAAIYGLVASEGVSHINGGSTPMGHQAVERAPEPASAIEHHDHTADRSVSHRDTAGSVSHRDMSADRMFAGLGSLGVPMPLHPYAWELSAEMMLTGSSVLDIACELSGLWFDSAEVALSPLHEYAVEAAEPDCVAA